MADAAGGDGEPKFLKVLKLVCESISVSLWSRKDKAEKETDGNHYADSAAP